MSGCFKIMGTVTSFSISRGLTLGTVAEYTWPTQTWHTLLPTAPAWLLEKSFPDLWPPLLSYRL